jgi:hypothetical protein
MSKVETQEEADRLNKDGTTEPYLAANGHMMVAPLRWPYHEACSTACAHERDYVVGDEIRYTSWDAWCVADCAACRSGDRLPDY